MRYHPAVIQGKSIVLEADPGLPDGQRVEVAIRPVFDREAHPQANRRT